METTENTSIIDTAVEQGDAELLAYTINFDLLSFKKFREYFKGLDSIQQDECKARIVARLEYGLNLTLDQVDILIDLGLVIAFKSRNKFFNGWGPARNVKALFVDCYLKTGADIDFNISRKMEKLADRGASYLSIINSSREIRARATDYLQIQYRGKLVNV